MTGPQGHQDWATSRSGLRVCLSLDFLHTLGVLPIYQLQGEEEQLQSGSGCAFGTSGLSSKWGFPLWSPFISVYVQRRAFICFLFYSSGDVDAGEMHW